VHGHVEQKQQTQQFVRRSHGLPGAAQYAAVARFAIGQGRETAVKGIETKSQLVA
jgi:hypothetical protein